MDLREWGVCGTSLSMMKFNDVEIWLHIEWGVLRFTLKMEIDDVLFSSSEVRCVVAHSQMIFEFVDDGA